MPESRKHDYYAVLSVIAISLLMLAAGIYTARLPDRHKAQGREVNQTHEVLERLHLLALHVTEAETGQRGFLLSGEPDYLAPYITADEQIADDLNDLERLTADNARQRSRLVELRRAITAKLEELTETITVRKQRRAEDALTIVLSGRGKQLMDVIRQRIREMKTGEEQLLESRLTAWNNRASQSRNIILAGSSDVYALVFAVYLALHKLAQQRHAIAEAERRSDRCCNRRRAQQISLHATAARSLHSCCPKLRAKVQNSSPNASGRPLPPQAGTGET
jgi:CHASE3 domain sensor protein